ncbi:hypothetical protein [Chelatococcus composti]|uniref:Uncharacterized protein n=1 Tax=Chelatococcus composti TaxID=1743235 RepID=A0A841K308_9HYPH|nr:hypothetical protein [Chelatococcus composti]MBB6167138.1 hypothetical protein [Chelatococcus composti]MBS7735348.1 hypothetical protein [Chelatococcus composti]GGG29534.1 hypothetical protein GCM10008026_07540 [Chelatococcus composti]
MASGIHVKLDFSLPFSLHVNGSFDIKAMEERFSVTLETIFKKNPQLRFAEHVENVAIINDDSDQIAYTKVSAEYRPAKSRDWTDYKASLELRNAAIAIANALISGARHALGKHYLYYVYHPKQLEPINVLINENGHSLGIGLALSGGITIQTSPDKLTKDSEFGRILSGAKTVSVADDIYIEAQRWLEQRDPRMALANLVISFETGLADHLLRIAAMRGNPQLEADVSSATLASLGERWSTELLGKSFMNGSHWGSDFTESFCWIRDARNSVLHKAKLLVVRRDGRSRDFTNLEELKKLFEERDRLMNRINSAVCQALSRQSSP